MQITFDWQLCSAHTHGDGITLYLAIAWYTQSTAHKLNWSWSLPKAPASLLIALTGCHSKSFSLTHGPGATRTTWRACRRRDGTGALLSCASARPGIAPPCSAWVCMAAKWETDVSLPSSLLFSLSPFLCSWPSGGNALLQTQDKCSMLCFSRAPSPVCRHIPHPFKPSSSSCNLVPPISGLRTWALVQRKLWRADPSTQPCSQVFHAGGSISLSHQHGACFKQLHINTAFRWRREIF